MGRIQTLLDNATKARAKATEAEAAVRAERDETEARRAAARLTVQRAILDAYDPDTHRQAIADAETDLQAWLADTPLGRLVAAVAEARTAQEAAARAAASLRMAGEDAPEVPAARVQLRHQAGALSADTYYSRWAPDAVWDAVTRVATERKATTEAEVKRRLAQAVESEPATDALPDDPAPLTFYEQRNGTPAQRAADREARRAEAYQRHIEYQRERGYDPVPYEAFGHGSIDPARLPNRDRARYGLPG